MSGHSVHLVKFASSQLLMHSKLELWLFLVHLVLASAKQWWKIPLNSWFTISCFADKEKGHSSAGLNGIINKHDCLRLYSFKNYSSMFPAWFQCPVIFSNCVTVINLGFPKCTYCLLVNTKRAMNAVCADLDQDYDTSWTWFGSDTIRCGLFDCNLGFKFDQNSSKPHSSRWARIEHNTLDLDC